MADTILRWSTVCNVHPDHAFDLLWLCRKEFPDIRFKTIPYCGDWWWVQALLEHERGAGWGNRVGVWQPESKVYAEAMAASLKRKAKAERLQGE